MKSAKYFIIGGILFLGAVGAWYYYQFKLALNYKVDFLKNRTKINKFTLDAMDIRSVVLVTNQSALDLQLNGFTADVSINDIFLTHIENQSPIDIPPNSSVELPIIINVNPQKLISLDSLKKLADAFISGGVGGINVTFKGDVSLETSGVTVKKYPYSSTSTVQELMGA